MPPLPFAKLTHPDAELRWDFDSIPGCAPRNLVGLHDPFVRLGWLDSLESTVARLGFQSPLVEYRDGLVVAHFADAPLELHH